MKRSLVFLLSTVIGFGSLMARDIPYLAKNQQTTSNNPNLRVLAEQCSPANTETSLDINNVRASILAGGDMWWNLNEARYEVPKNSNKHSMFAGALWLGGIDEGRQLKLAAMTYRQRGNDYWPGPLTRDGLASVTKETCEEYDQHWVVTREEVAIHAAWLDCKANPDCNDAEEFPGYSGQIPSSILNWPGDGINFESPGLAPYINTEGGAEYDPNTSYPAYDLRKEFDCTRKETDILYGDQTIWYVYNDKGNIHTETNAGALGFEIRAQAFAFSTNDEVNNMTFNNYRIINRSTFRLVDTYFSTWFDPDLGNATDDIIGCDIPRGLAYVYNADNDDEGARGYGLNPPALGFDFFQGPFADYFDGRDNDRDGCIDGVRNEEGICVPEDEATGVNERIIMSGFMYYNNTSNSTSGNPSNAGQFYNYMRSKWRNGLDLIVESPSGPGNPGNGDGIVPSGNGTVTLFAYPGETYDTTGVTPPTTPLIPGWYESPDNQEDKRGLHNAGPFSLAPGALNFITTGVVWERDRVSTDLFASVEKVIIADDKAQQLFDNCFRVLDGPDAPDMSIVELDQRLVIQLSNGEISNNFNLGYSERDPLIVRPDVPDSIWDPIFAANPKYFNYVFEGYQVYQLANAEVSISDLDDPTQARLIAQSDLKNGVTQLTNWEINPEINNLEPTNMTPIYNNDGIVTSIEINEDVFAEGDRKLINHKEYYFTVIAYAYNEYSEFSFSNPGGQKKPYLAGRRNIRTYSAIPNKRLATGASGLSDYGDSPEITRIEGLGNSSNFLRLTEGSIQEILDNPDKETPITYQQNAGPLTLKVVDPENVPSGDYSIEFGGVDESAGWKIIDNSTNEVIAESSGSINSLNEQIIPQLGMSMLLTNPRSNPGNDSDGVRNGGIIGSEIVYEDPTKRWFFGVPDADNETPLNWIWSGTNRASEEPGASYPDFGGDPKGYYKNILDGTWSAGTYLSTSIRKVADNIYDIYGMGPGDPIGRIDEKSMNRIHDVDVVFSPNPDEWTRVPILEMGEDVDLTEGGAKKFELRKATGKKKDPNNPSNLIDDVDNPGWTYFPGYAIDVQTGKRLNMFIGENSWMRADNGNDMLWNPSPRVVEPGPGDNVTGGYKLGGQHYVYVMADNYRQGINFIPNYYQGDNPADNPLYTQFQDMGFVANKRSVFQSVAWATIPVMAPNFAGINPYTEMPTRVTVRLRLDLPYENYAQSGGSNNGNPLYNFNTGSLSPKIDFESVKNEIMEDIKIVPNPYYGESLYETSQLDNTVKIINLPKECTISIFSVNGLLVKQIRKDNPSTFEIWDLKNEYGVPIAGGVYIFHIKAPGLGETTLKWFGTLRPVDLNAF